MICFTCGEQLDGDDGCTCELPHAVSGPGNQYRDARRNQTDAAMVSVAISVHAGLHPQTLTEIDRRGGSRWDSAKERRAIVVAWSR